MRSRNWRLWLLLLGASAAVLGASVLAGCGEEQAARPRPPDGVLVYHSGVSSVVRFDDRERGVTCYVRRGGSGGGLWCYRETP